MEKEIQISTQDNFLIYGNLNTRENISENPNKKLIVFAHGFTGNQNEHIFFNSAKFFPEKGFDTFRMNFYCGEENARHFENTNLIQHGQDLTEVMKYFSEKYEKIFLVGHSFGGTSLLFAKTDMATALVFWDASFISPSYIESFKKSVGYIKEADLYFDDYGQRTIIGKGFLDELYSSVDSASLVRNIKIPVKFITAGEEGAKDGENYFSNANEPKELVNIPNADHCFDTIQSENKLLSETYNFLEKY